MLPAVRVLMEALAMILWQIIPANVLLELLAETATKVSINKMPSTPLQKCPMGFP